MSTIWIWCFCFFFHSLKFVHFPLGFSSSWSPSLVEHHGSFLANATITIGRVNRRRRASSFPIATTCESLRPPSTGFAFLPSNEEKPFFRISMAQISWKFWIIKVIEWERETHTHTHAYIYISFINHNYSIKLTTWELNIKRKIEMDEERWKILIMWVKKGIK